MRGPAAPVGQPRVMTRRSQRDLRPGVGALVAALAAPMVARGAAVRGLRAPPTVSGDVNDLVGGAADTKVAAFNAKAAAATVRARAVAAQAAATATRAEELQVTNEAKKPVLEKDLGVATSQAIAANKAANGAVAALAQTKAIAATAVDDAKKLAVEEVKARLKDMYHRLDEWRSHVLNSPYDNARAAGKRATKPYNDMIRKIRGKIGNFQLQASTYMGQANSLENGAEGIAAGAQGKLDSGDVVGANQDLMTAQSMQGRAAAEASAASSLQAQANGMNHLIAKYVQAGHMAAWKAEYLADPDALPPPPQDPNYAFTPPPPPASAAMLQLGKSGAEGRTEEATATATAHAAELRAAEGRTYAAALAAFKAEQGTVNAEDKALEPDTIGALALEELSMRNSTVVTTALAKASVSANATANATVAQKADTVDAACRECVSEGHSCCYYYSSGTGWEASPTAEGTGVLCARTSGTCAR